MSAGPLVGPAVDRLRGPGVAALATADGLEVAETDLHVVTAGTGDHLGEVVHRLHHGQRLDERAAHR